ncbi:MAG: DUF6206 family protein [bacterium]
MQKISSHIIERLKQFEKNLDPRFPERNGIPTKVLGYGEISTVLAIETETKKEFAYKRLPMFKAEEEAVTYEALFREYNRVLKERIGLDMVPSATVRLKNKAKDYVTVYIIQEKLPPDCIGHRVIHHITPEETERLIRAVLKNMKKVFDFNREHENELEVALDGQISNWGVVGFDAKRPRLHKDVELVFLDTSSPLMRKDGVEQLDSEWYLRAAPSFLVWIIRLLFVKDILNRYYDFRKVVIDLVANFYKEQRHELIPDLVNTVNDFFRDEIEKGDFKPISVTEVKSYYREDAWIWRIYLTFRKIDRFLHRLIGKDYPYILPANIKR